MFQAFKKLIIAVGVLVALAYVGNLLIDNPYVHGLIRNAINEKLEQYTHLSIKFEAINAKFIPPGFDIYGVEVLQKKADGTEETLTQIAHLQVRVSLLALALSQTEMLAIEINEPRISLPLPPIEELIRIEQFPDWNKKSELPPWPLDVTLPLKHVRIGNAMINLKIPGSQPEAPDALSLRLEGLNMDFAFSTWEDFSLAVQLKRSNLALNGSDVVRDLGLQLDLQQENDQLLSQKFLLESEDLQAKGQVRVVYETELKKSSGALQDKNARQLKGLLIRIDNQVTRADIGILGRYLGIDQTAGPLFGSTELQLHVPLDDRALSWRLDGKGQSQSAELFGFKLLDSQLDFNITDQGMTFEKAHVRKGSQELAAGSGFIGFTKEVPFRFNIEPKNLAFGELMSVLGIDDFTAFSAFLDSPEIKLYGEALPFAMHITGPARFSQISLPFVADLPKRYMEAPTCVFQTALHINAEALSIGKGEGQCWKSLGREQSLPTEGGSPVNLGGKFFFSTERGMDFTIETPKLDTPLLEHFTKLSAQGFAKVQARIRGPYDHLTIGGRASGKNVVIGGFDMRELEASYKLDIERSLLQIDDLYVGLADQGALAVDAFEMGIGAPYVFKANVTAQKIPPEFLAAGLKETFGVENFRIGFPSLRGAMSGPLLEPFIWQGDLDFSLNELTWKEEELISEASGTIRSDEKHWSLSKSYARLDQLEARTSLDIQRRGGNAAAEHILHQLGIRPADRVRLSIKTINQNLKTYRTNEVAQEINHLTSLPYVGTFFAEQKFGGQIQLEAELEGPIDHLQGKVEGGLEQPYVWGIPISSFSFAGFVDGWKLHIPELRHSGNALVGRLNIDFGKSSLPYDWYFYFNQMDIRALIGSFFAEDPRNFAYLTAEWTMQGELSNFWGSKGELVLNRVRSKLFRNLGSRTSSVELNSDDPIKLKISPQGWTLAEKKPLRLQGEYFDLSFEAGDNRLPDQLDLSVHGSVKLDLLKNFSNVIETARGEILIDGYLRGSLSKPDLSIKLREKRLDPFNVKDWQAVSIGLVDYGPALTSVALDVEIKDDRVIVNKFKANKGREGSMTVSGQLNFNGSSPEASRLNIDLNRMEFNRLSVPVLKTADLTLSGKLAVTGHKLPLNLSGNLEIDRLQSIGNFDLRKQIVASLYETRLNSSASVGSEQTPFVNLDIGVVADSSITIKNKSLEALLSADMRVRGTEMQPLLTGQIIADRGTFNYRRTFKISQAVISFDEPISPPNPRLDIVGEATVNPYTVEVMVDGHLNTPRIQLSVDPANRDDGSPITNLDILILISTGRIPDQTNKTTAQSAESASINELVSFFAAFAEEPIEKLFDMSGQTVIREVYFDSYLPEQGQRPVTRINFPIRLGENLSAVLQVDDAANTKVSLEYVLHEGISVSGSLDQTTSRETNDQKALPADTGFDLKFRFGFD
ncbi:translocation/assembly module TamB domain-containing protein [Oligoflexus tunisiensis]|uniref:translocation/assembly module TamB domain-containing protein n=1 Tax=Oligoflexus tunisiensis TaxID=708132 RepID=UPI00114CAEAE|nr:translocation/assembly module TamB domain-containing protein [Oligoflexus tunisiensis]